MIQPIKSNIAFKGNDTQAPIEGKKFDVAAAYKKVKKGATDIAKDVITTVNVGGGAVHGVRDAIIITGATSMIGKALKEAKDEKGLKVLGTIATNIVKDSWNGLKGALSWGKRVLVEDKATYKL